MTARARLLVLVALAAGCAGTPAPSGERWWDPPAATPTPVEERVPTPVASRPCEVDVLDREPAVAFDLVGLVEVQGRGPVENADEALSAAKRRACDLGGDAIVILFRRSGREGGLPQRADGRGILSEPQIRAAVLRYR